MSLPAILLVDDSEAVLAYETAALSRDYALRTASDGRKALTAMRAERPDLVLLDLSMPVCNGDEVLAAMRRDPGLALVPVIIVTSEADRAAICLRGGATAYLPKPIRAGDLREVVGRVLAESRSTREAFDLRTLVLRVGGRPVGIPLRTVRHVVLRPATDSRVISDGVAVDTFDFHGEEVAVIEAEATLGLSATVPPIERWVVILVGAAPCIGLGVDGVVGPEVFAPDSTEARVGSEDDVDATFGVPVLARVKLGGVVVPIIDPDVALPAGLRPLVRAALTSPLRRDTPERPP